MIRTQCSLIGSTFELVYIVVVILTPYDNAFENILNCKKLYVPTAVLAILLILNFISSFSDLWFYGIFDNWFGTKEKQEKEPDQFTDFKDIMSLWFAVIKMPIELTEIWLLYFYVDRIAETDSWGIVHCVCSFIFPFFTQEVADCGF